MSGAMPKHLRHPSWDQQGYRPDMHVMGPSASMYNPRLSLPSTYYPGITGQPAMLASDGQSNPSVDYSVYDGTNAPAVMHPHLSSSHRASSGAWNQDDDSVLLEARQRGLNWNQIQVKHFPKKTPNACRKRHERLIDRRGVDDFDTRRFENMAKAYVMRRKEIWQLLALLTGEKWNVVEAKMLSSGLKNIQSAARAASRRERLASGQPLPPDFDDDMDDLDGMGIDDMDHYGSPHMPNGDVSTADGPITSTASYPSSHLQLPPYYSSHAHDGSSYPSSASSVANVPVSNSYSLDQSHAGSHANSRASSPYVHVHEQHRLSSGDMGIEAIINRPIVSSEPL